MKRLALFLLLLVLGTGLGCYTMLRHPQAGDFVSEEPGSSCVDCHSGPEYSHWTDPYYSSIYGYSPSLWGAYYAQPWWYDQHWYSTPSGSGGGAPLPTGGRNAWDRGPGAPASPYVPPVGTGSVSSGSAGTATPSVTPADTSHTNKPDKPAKEEPKKEEPKRRAWGR